MYKNEVTTGYHWDFLRFLVGSVRVGTDLAQVVILSIVLVKLWFQLL